MPGQKKNLDMKYAAVIAVMKGEKVARVARKHGVHRNIVHIWVKEANEGIKEALIPKKPGRKPKPTQKPDPHLEVIEELNCLLEEKERQIKKLEETVKFQKDIEPRPPKCEKCGCKKVYRNGSYWVKAKNLLNFFSEDETMRIPIFICANCDKPVHFDFKKNFLYLLRKLGSSLVK